MTVFLDTVGLLAVWDESDPWHRAAQMCFLELLSCRADLVTSSFVLLECGNAAARRPYRSAGSQPHNLIRTEINGSQTHESVGS